MSDPDDLPGDDAGPDQGRSRVRKSATAFRTISEVADDLHIPQHVLRFWETKFPQVKPLKRGGGRRYYRPADLVLLRRISELLYIQGYTIKGVQRLLREGQGRLDDDLPLLADADATEPDEEAVEDELDLSQVSDEDLLRMMREDAARAELPAKPRESEASRLRAVLHETLAALESLRAMLG